MFGFFKKKASVPEKLRDKLIQLGQWHPNTPDFHSIGLTAAQPVFITDEMMRGNRAHSILDTPGVKRYAVAYSIRRFTMFRKRIGHKPYPVVLPPMSNVGGYVSRSEVLPVRGELYFINPYKLVQLDDYKENGRVFKRERIQLDIPYRVKEAYDRETVKLNGTTTVMRSETVEVINADVQHNKGQWAWMYIGLPEHFYWSNYVPDGSFKPVRPVRPADCNAQPYYHYKEINVID